MVDSVVSHTAKEMAFALTQITSKIPCRILVKFFVQFCLPVFLIGLNDQMNLRGTYEVYIFKTKLMIFKKIIFFQKLGF